MTVGDSTTRQLLPFMPKETIDQLYARLVVSLENAQESMEPISLTADLMMATCCDEVIKGWQSKQKTHRVKTLDMAGIECDVRVSSITPTKSQIVAACQGPTESLGDMRAKVIAAVRRAVKRN